MKSGESEDVMFVIVRFIFRKEFLDKHMMIYYFIKQHWAKLFCFAVLFCFSAQGQATEGTLNFYVTPELPTSQVSEGAGYFDLLLKPGQQERLSLKLQNASEQSIELAITPHTAYTNVHGVVEYGKDAEQPNTTMIHSIDEMIAPMPSIQLKGNETKTVDLLLTMPKESFEGFLAGGLRIVEVNEGSTDESQAEGLAIKNEFAYVVGVLVSNSRNAVPPQLELVDVFADQLNYRNVFSATIQNPMPTFVNRLAVEATIQKENEILYHAQEQKMQMAPNSHFNFPISLAGDRFQPGEYLLTMKAQSGEDSWEWEQTVTIQADEARALNQRDVTITSTMHGWLVALLVIGVLIVLLFILLIWRKKHREVKT